MPSGLFPEWLDVNAGRAFPLAENSSRLDLTGTIKLPNSLIVAAQINQTVDYAAGSFFISTLTVAPDVIALEVSFLDSGVARVISTVGITVAQHQENQSYAFVGSNQDQLVLGSLTIGSLVETLLEIPGRVFFAPSATPFEVSALFISVQALEAIEVYNGNTLVGSFSKVLKLRAGENIRLTLENDDPDIIRIDAIQGENLVTPDTCENAILPPPCIRTINDIAPDQNGNFNLDGGDCLSVNVEEGSIRLQDLCSQSCCGCTELETLLAGLVSIESQAALFRQQLTDTIGTMGAMISNLSSNIR